jgi:hypothetical protein
VLVELLDIAGLLDAEGIPQPEPARAFLEASRGEALALLARAWLHSERFNELRLLPGLAAEGDWKNDPLRARQAVLDFLSTLPPTENTPEPPFWSLGSFVAAVRQAYPDFQRPAGDYESWYVRDQASGEFLRGFEHWEAVDGALIRYLITGPMHWLGMVDLASFEAEAPAPPAAFRLSAWAPGLLTGANPPALPPENASLKVASDARLYVSRRTPRSARYQLARFCAWDGEDEDGYRYRLAPSALERARKQGLRTSHLLALLRRHAASVPPNLARALDRWEEQGAEARLEQLLVLRVSAPEVLQALRGSRAARFLGAPLGPAAIIVKPGAWEKVIAVLAELGYLGEMVLPDEGNNRTPNQSTPE